MIRAPEALLPELFATDETAWLERTAALIRDGKTGELDYPNIAEYLEDMVRRDRREVKSRLIDLLLHLLKWEHQPDKRSGSWRATIVEQRQELTELLASRTLRNHAESTLDHAYLDAVQRASAETEIHPKNFAGRCPYTLEELLSQNLDNGK